MSYDARDRLTQATSSMFGTAGYGYDALDNLTTVNVGGPQARGQVYCYSSNRLSTVRTGSCSGSIVHSLAYDVQGNLASKGAQAFGFDYGNRLREVDLPPLSHANSTFIQGANRAQLSPDQTISLARTAGLKEGHTFFIGACNVGADGGAYAQSLADKNNSLVLAATGFSMFPTTAPKAGGTPYKPGDPVTLRVDSQRDGKGAAGTFAVFAPGGNGPIASGIRSVTYNPETGKAQLRMAPETGSRIGRTVSVCADNDKCGK
ncbi:RHS repeat protein [Pseudoxanthomonas koreensis]|uniref:RHS repeat protein n=1 Tax=Pseudoxanthomonas koreensis TaxID=266061 RepID=UPI0013912CD6|nr:RHS repeat protein [Pseudoxanthomonas koreensis]